MEDQFDVGAEIAAISDGGEEQPETTAEIVAEEEPTEESGAEPEELEGESDDSQEVEAHEVEEPRKKPVEKRISELTRKRYEAEREAAYWKQQAEEKAKVQVASTQEDQEPQIEAYADYDAYVRDLARFQARQIVREETRRIQEGQQAQQLEEENRKRVENARKAVNKAAEQHDDFYEAMEVVTAAPIPNIVSDAIMDSHMVADIIYHLGKHPEEVERITKLSPLAQIKEIGKIEDKITSRQTLKQKQVKQPTRVEAAGAGHQAKGPDMDQLWKRAQKSGDYTEYYKARGIIS